MRLPAAGQRRDDDDQRHHGQILEQQHAHDLLAVRRVQFGALDQHLADDRGGRHRQHAAQRQPGAPVQPEEQRGEHDQQHGGDHLRSAQAEHQALHAAQARQAELQPDAEHQEHHAEFGQMAGFRRIGYPAQRMRPDQDADQQIAQHHRQTQDAAQHHHAPRRRQAGSARVAASLSYACTSGIVAMTG